jgi:hypothetical protein
LDGQRCVSALFGFDTVSAGDRKTPRGFQDQISALVPVEGIEPTLLAEHDFESCASTSSATRAASMIRKTGSRFSNKIMRTKVCYSI